MKTKGLTIYLKIITLLSLVALTTEASAEQTIRLDVGQQRILTYRNMDKVAVGDSNVADVRRLGKNRILIQAVSSGSTSIIIIRRQMPKLTFRIIVSKLDPHKLVRLVKKILGDMEGVKIRRVGEQVYLDGYALTSADYQKIHKVVKLFPQVKSFVKLNPGAIRHVARTIRETLHNSGMRNIKVKVIGNTIFLEGSVESKRDLKKAGLITRALGPPVENLIAIGIKRMLLLDVQFLKVTTDSGKNIGIKWPAAFGIGGKIDGAITLSPQSGTSMGITLTGVESQLLLNTLFENGIARTLAHPKLVCASGEKAKFLSGGEVPIVFVNNNIATVTYKEYGIRLNVAPLADADGNIQVQMMTEVSKPDWSHTVQGYPAFVTNRVKTNVTVRHGETIVLSGLLHSSEQKAVSKFPLLGNIPIIGEFFKNRTFQNEKTELVVFVTPRIVNPDTPRIKSTINSMREKYKKAKGAVGFGILD